MFNFRSSKMFVVVLVVLVFATAAFAFAASNTVPTSYAGDGFGTISGYTVSNIAYGLNGTTPSNLDSVSFTLSAAANTVKIKLVATGTTYYDCAATNAPTNTNWSCTTTGATVSAADQLRVIATN
jgi:hypothetical protein